MTSCWELEIHRKKQTLLSGLALMVGQLYRLKKMMENTNNADYIEKCVLSEAINL